MTHVKFNTIAITNGKGGCGKTSVAGNIAGLAAASGWKVLTIDLDPQGDLTNDLGAYRNDYGKGMVASVWLDQPLSANAATVTDVRPNLDLVCGGDELNTLQSYFASDSRPESVNKLRSSISSTAHNYDLVIVDCPPASNALTKAIYNAVQHLIIPTKPDRASIDGLVGTANIYAGVKQSTNPLLSVLGVCLFDIGKGHTVSHRTAKADIGEVLGVANIELFDGFIRHAAKASIDVRRKHQLVHEYATEASNAEPFYEAMKNNRPPPRFGTNAKGLAEDYIHLWKHIRNAYQAAHEANEGNPNE